MTEILNICPKYRLIDILNGGFNMIKAIKCSKLIILEDL